MAMVRKCDQCSTIEGVLHYTLRWDSSTGQADLCAEHGGNIVQQFTVSHGGTVAPRGRTGRRRGPGLTKVTTIEDIEKGKESKKS